MMYRLIQWRSLRIKIKASKTDPFRQGVDIFVGRTGNELCPVVATLAYMVQRRPGPGPLFKFQDGKPLTRQRFVARVREALTSAGVDSSAYSGHTFRSGAATTAAKCGVSDVVIKMLRRWKSSAYQLYIKTPRDQFQWSQLRICNKYSLLYLLDRGTYCFVLQSSITE